MSRTHAYKYCGIQSSSGMMPMTSHAVAIVWAAFSSLEMLSSALSTDAMAT